MTDFCTDPYYVKVITGFGGVEKFGEAYRGKTPPCRHRHRSETLISRYVPNQSIGSTGSFQTAGLLLGKNDDQLQKGKETQLEHSTPVLREDNLNAATRV